MLGILERRSKDAEAAGAKPRNQLTVAALAALFDARKQVRSQQEVADLARFYNVDPAVLDRLASYYNSPSVESQLSKAETRSGTMTVSFAI